MTLSRFVSPSSRSSKIMSTTAKHACGTRGSRLVETLPFSRDDLEFVLMLVLAAAFGYSLGRPVLWASLAREPSDERDAWFRRRLAKMVEGSLLASRGGTRTSTP
jgi:hypothetical protein